MSDWVVDASVAAKWAVPEVDSAQAQQLIPQVVSAGGRLLLLDVAVAEVVNVIWKQYHRKLASLDEARQMVNLLLQVPFEVVASRPLLPTAFELAARYGCAVYDALFIALTSESGVASVTADEPLYKVAHADYPQIHLLRLWLPPTP